MRTIIYLVLLCISNTALGQTTGKQIHFKEVGWTLKLPDKFVWIDSTESSMKSARGLKAIEEANDVELDISDTRKLFSGRVNSSYFDATLTPFDSTMEDYKTSIDYSRLILFRTFEDKLPGVSVDSTLATFMIDDLPFDQFLITLKRKKKVLMTAVLVSTHFRGFNINISYLYKDQLTRREIEQCLIDSKFAEN